ncbi:hypothetical protein HYDPIDRAFT_32117 [Hydnomerulius pinastri MD-312]|uniref:Uncharacterized protein n=1 Tax=Hydnomerulius pinastri MD-312 TaxID=994086 RepID=A0A0C9VS87_9AGAM|nr:hypothetical protein HYDPIDRAFT_32117 [Hydnomerulius pinastri MD-312]
MSPTHHLTSLPNSKPTTYPPPKCLKTPPTPQIAIRAPQKPPERPRHLLKALATSRMTQPPPKHLPNALATPKHPRRHLNTLKTHPSTSKHPWCPKSPSEHPRNHLSALATSRMTQPPPEHLLNALTPPERPHHHPNFPTTTRAPPECPRPT